MANDSPASRQPDDTSGPDRPLVVQTEALHPDAVAWLGERCRLVRCEPEAPGFEALLAGADGLVIRTYTRVDDALLKRAPRLRVIGRAGVGLDNVDVAACERRGVRVVNTPDANTGAVVEYVFAMLLDVLRRRVVLDDAVDAAGWRTLRAELGAASREIGALTLGIWGFGRIGSRVGRVAEALGARVIFHDLLDVPDDRRGGARPVSRDGLLELADVVTLHVDGRSENRGLVGADALGRMRPGAILVNAARGFVVDEAALVAWLRANPAACAILDVHATEPVPPDSALLGLPNALLTPHIGAATEVANRAMSMVVRDVWEVLAPYR